MQCIDTVNQKTIANLVQYLNIDPEHMVKTLIVIGKNVPLVALILRGDDELNIVKAAKHPLIQNPLCFADADIIQEHLKVGIGSLGPVNLNIPVIVDYYVAAMPTFICGSNVDDKHFINVMWGRDVAYENLWDLRNVKIGDISPDGVGKLDICRGIEVGHVFKLGNKYSQAMHLTVLDKAGKAQEVLMGCYGFGVSRIVAAIIEQHHNDSGIVWPLSVAPFAVVIIPINWQNCELVMQKAIKLYDEFIALGIEVLLDDRQERAGVLFADNDLIGIPQRLIISERTLEHDNVEYKNYCDGSSQLININQIINYCL